MFSLHLVALKYLKTVIDKLTANAGIHDFVVKKKNY